MTGRWSLSLAGTLLQNSVALGAILYAVLRLSYVLFYLQVRATPEEVGYGYAEVLASEVVGTMWLVALLTVPLTAVVWLGQMGWTRLAHQANDRNRVTSPERPLAALRRLGSYSAVLSVMVVLVGVPVVAWSFGAEAANGRAVRNVYVLRTLRLPVLAVQAVPAHVVATEDSPGAASLERRRCLLYLGSSDGTAVFYDVSTAESVRVPNAQVIIQLDNVVAVRDECH